MELFEQGVKLTRDCQKRLDEAERRIEVLLRDSEGRTIINAFDEAELDEPATDEMEDDESVF